MKGTGAVDLVSEALFLARRVLHGAGEGGRAEIHDENVSDISTVGDRAVTRELVDFFKISGLPATLQSEESGRLDLCASPLYTVVIDDIDGTDNFFRGNGLLPYCTIISVLSGLKPTFSDTLAAGIIEHRTGAMWLAEKGKGCFWNGASAHSSQNIALNRRTLVAIDHYGSARDLDHLSRLHSDAWIKDFGSSGFHLAGVANGMFDAFVNTGQKGHEIAAGYLVITEASGTLTDLTGRPFDAMLFDFDASYEIIAAGNRTLSSLIVDALRPADPATH